MQNYEDIFIAVRGHVHLTSEPPFEEGVIEERARHWKLMTGPILGPHLGLSEEKLNVYVERAIGELKEQLTVTQDYGNTINDETHEPWWIDFKSGNNDLHYWNRFSSLLKSSGQLPLEIVARLDSETDDIIDLIGSPKKEGVWSRRGMVIGHVQSGKTQNYSAVICKAADAGYQIIVLLTGTTNSLRRQTQERINEAFIGKQASKHQALMNRRIGVGLPENDQTKRFPNAGTYLEGDFSAAALQTATGFQLGNFKEPIIFVCKKNVNTLENLLKYFESYQEEGKINNSLLLIDDEADNASINTRKETEEITRTNSGIRNILKKFIRSSYIGYTATPFANIFIDPDNDDDMTEDDLFPANYIRTLEAPSNYMGANKIFSSNANFFERMVVSIDDFQDILPLKHKNHHPLNELPPSLRTAIIHFIIAKTIRICRGDGAKHCTMMVNVSLFNSVQDRVHGLIYSLVEEFKNDIRMNALATKPSSKSVIHEFRVEYSREFSEKIEDETFEYPSWDEVKKHLFTFELDVQTINKGGTQLNYDEFKDTGKNVIAIGGLALSRGLTLEGLCNTYILRNAAAYDTLMQMGRWFGYRPNYEDLCRLYLDEKSIDHYQATSEAIDELRDEIKFMKSAELTPKEFGLKVRQSPYALRITAANKMRTSKPQIINIGYGGKTIEGHTIFQDPGINAQNLELTKTFLLSLGKEAGNDDFAINTKTKIWADVNVNKVIDFIDKFSLPIRSEGLAKIGKERSFVSEFINQKRKELQYWNIHLNNVVSANHSSDNEYEFSAEIFENEKLYLRRRTGGFDEQKKFYKISNNRKVGSGDDARAGLSKQDFEDLSNNMGKVMNHDIKAHQSFKPTLIIYFVRPRVEDKILPEHLVSGVVSFVVHFPDNRVSLKSVPTIYQTNKVFQQLELFEDSEDYDSEMQELENENV